MPTPLFTIDPSPIKVSQLLPPALVTLGLVQGGLGYACFYLLSTPSLGRWMMLAGGIGLYGNLMPRDDQHPMRTGAPIVRLFGRTLDLQTTVALTLDFQWASAAACAVFRSWTLPATQPPSRLFKWAGRTNRLCCAAIVAGWGEHMFSSFQPGEHGQK